MLSTNVRIRADLFEFVEALIGWNFDNLHVLVTSRKKNEITTSLEAFITCQLCTPNALIDADIRVHILEMLSNDPKLKKRSFDAQKEIERALLRVAQGM